MTHKPKLVCALPRRFLLQIVLATLLLGLSPRAFAQAVAMVSDMVGRVTADLPLTIDSDLPVDARVRIEAGGTLEVIYYRSGEEFILKGPSTVHFRASGPELIGGPQPLRRMKWLAAGNGIKFNPRVRMGGTTWRNVLPAIRLLNLSHHTATLDGNPEFRWEADAGIRYRFEVRDESGILLHEADVEGGSFMLPDSMQLRSGARYRWQVSARLAGGGRYASSGDFSIARAELQALAHELRPRAAAAVSERVVYAAWLEQENLWDEARKYWRALSTERPGDAQLKKLAGSVTEL